MGLQTRSSACYSLLDGDLRANNGLLGTGMKILFQNGFVELKTVLNTSMFSNVRRAVDLG